MTEKRALITEPNPAHAGAVVRSLQATLGPLLAQRKYR
jgi:hypothetical protein